MSGFVHVEAFTCAICERQIDTRWNMPGRAMTIPPFCQGCEHQYTQGIGMPTAGSFRDRRQVQRGFAIAEALHSAAAQKRWSDNHGNA